MARTLNCIVAVSQNMGIGKAGDLPWPPLRYLPRRAAVRAALCRGPCRAAPARLAAGRGGRGADLGPSRPEPSRSAVRAGGREAGGRPFPGLPRGARPAEPLRARPGLEPAGGAPSDAALSPCRQEFAYFQRMTAAAAAGDGTGGGLPRASQRRLDPSVVPHGRPGASVSTLICVPFPVLIPLFKRALRFYAGRVQLRPWAGVAAGWRLARGETRPRAGAAGDESAPGSWPSV